MDQNIEISPFGNLLVYKKGYTREFVFNLITARKLSGLRIFSILEDQKLDNLNFLSEYSFLEALDITSHVDFDFGFLNELGNLKQLTIATGGQNIIDFHFLPKLEKLVLHWRKSITGLETCSNISELTLVDFKENDLIRLGKLKNIEHLKIKTGSIRTMNGIDTLGKLQKLEIGNCRCLETIAAINHLVQLKILEIEQCRQIEDFDALTDLPSLFKLALINCGKISSIKFIRNFNALISLSILEDTVIIDGDLFPAKSLESVFYKHRPHYNINLEKEIDKVRIRNNLEKIRKGLQGEE